MERSLDAVSAQAAEQEKRQIVGENVGRMRTEMIEEIRDESVGGNAGSIVIDGKEYPCAGANFTADRHTGRIGAFGNRAVAGPGEVTMAFRIAVDVGRDEDYDCFFRIVSVVHDRKKDVIDRHAVDVLQRSVDAWNASRVTNNQTAKII